MRFVYEYRKSDNSVCHGEVVAPNRDAAYKLLRQKGVRASRLDEAPGVFNKLFGKGKRWLLIGFLAIAAVAFAVLWSIERNESLASANSSLTTPRHQIYGDPVLMMELESNGYTNVFPRKIDSLLARFAQPGVTPSGLDRRWREDLANCAGELDGEYVAVGESDGREVKELKQIVNGMRDELRRYLSNGNGTLLSYARRLEERQVREYQIYLATKNELEKETDHRKWLEKNAALRALGIKTIPLKSPENE